MLRPTTRHRIPAALVTLALAGSALCAFGAGAASASSTAAASYCRSQGGTVQYRTPAFGTNNQAGQLGLAGRLGFCRFKSKADGSRVYVSLATLASPKPTLAALAYLEKPPTKNGSPNANPASVYCSQLGGSDSFGGINAAGGGWVLKSDTANPVLEACVFPDLSSIDSWALAYHANGAVRGKDLTKILRYQPTSLPAVFAA